MVTTVKSQLDGLPMLAKVAAVVGVPSAIAMYLVWTLTSSVASAAQAERIATEVHAHITRTEVLSAEREKQLEAQIRLLRLMCQSVAKTESVRVACSQ